jgi:hypothetical protein
MRKIMLAAAALGALPLALSIPARAADLPIKAPPMVAAVNPTLIWYVGLGAEGSTEQADVKGTNLFATSLINQGGSLQASGGAVTGAVGFLNNRQRWFRCQATVAYQNIAGANGAIGSLDSRWSATQECDVGYEWLAQITALLPNLINITAFPQPGLPSNVAVVSGAPKQYVGVLAKESQLSGQFFGAAGSTWDWAPGFGTGWIWQTADATGKANGGLIDAYLNVTFPQRGFTVAGIAGPGAPVFSGGAHLGTQYTVGFRFDLPVL